jgi:hypothetical protein
MSQKATKAAAVKKPAGKRKGANGYKLPDPIPVGEIVRGVNKKEWQIGPSIGVGGFGEIYAGTVITKYVFSFDELKFVETKV